MQEGATFDQTFGVWNPEMPRENMIDPRPQKIAEASSSLDINSTKFRIDLGFNRKIGLLAFINLRATSLGLLDVWIGDTSISDYSSPVFYSGTLPCWPVDSVAGEFTPWGEWTLNGVYNIEEYTNIGMTRFLLLDEEVTGRYIKVEIRDTLNVDPLKIGCFCVCEIWEATDEYQLALGWNISAIDISDVLTVPFGSTDVVKRGIRRQLDMGIQGLSESDFQKKVLGLMLIKGRNQPLIALPVPDETESLEKLGVYGRVPEDGTITNSLYALYAYAFQLRQEI